MNACDGTTSAQDRRKIRAGEIVKDTALYDDVHWFLLSDKKTSRRSCFDFRTSSNLSYEIDAVPQQVLPSTYPANEVINKRQFPCTLSRQDVYFVCKMVTATSPVIKVRRTGPIEAAS